MNIPTDTTAITKCNEIATFLRWSRRWAWHAIPKCKFGFVGHRTSMASTADCSGYKIHTYVSYSLAYLKYLNKYALTTNVSAYVNTFVCQNYLCKIVLLCIFVPACQKWKCQLFVTVTGDRNHFVWIAKPKQNLLHLLSMWSNLQTSHMLCIF